MTRFYKKNTLDWQREIWHSCALVVAPRYLWACIVSIWHAKSASKYSVFSVESHTTASTIDAILHHRVVKYLPVIG